MFVPGIKKYLTEQNERRFHGHMECEYIDDKIELRACMRIAPLFDGWVSKGFTEIVVNGYKCSNLVSECQETNKHVKSDVDIWFESEMSFVRFLEFLGDKMKYITETNIIFGKEKTLYICKRYILCSKEIVDIIISK